MSLVQTTWRVCLFLLVIAAVPGAAWGQSPTGWSGYVVVEHTRSGDNLSQREEAAYTFQGGLLPNGAAGPNRWDIVGTWDATYEETLGGTDCPVRSTGSGTGTAAGSILFTAGTDGLWEYSLSAGSTSVGFTVTSRSCSDPVTRTENAFPASTANGNENVLLPAGATPQNTTVLQGDRTFEGVGADNPRIKLWWFLTRAPDPPECADGRDNDNDGLTDYSAGITGIGDPGCESAQDNSEADSTLEVRKELDPPYASGRFDLLIDGQTYASRVGNAGSTGAVSVSSGVHTVAEGPALDADGKATNLRRYDSEITCDDRTTSEEILSQDGFGPASVTVSPGHEVVCTIRNGPPPGALVVTGGYMHAGALGGPFASVAGGDGVAVVGPADAIGRVSEVCITSTWSARVVYRIATTLRIEWNGEVIPFISSELVGTVTKTSKGFFTNVATETVTYKACQPGTSARFGPWPGTDNLLAASIQPITKFSHKLTVEAVLDDGTRLAVKVPGASSKSGGAVKWWAQRSHIFSLL